MSSKMLSEFVSLVCAGDFVVLDTETSGLLDAEIVQIAIINQDAEVLLDTFVKPSMPIPVEATGVHGITDEMVAEYPPWGLVWAEVADLLEGRAVIVYNAKFDLPMLYSATLAAGVAAFDWAGNSDWYCAMRAFAEVYGSFDKKRQSFRWQTLSTACAYFSGSDPQLHRALADCRNTLFVIRSIAALPLS